MTYRIVTETNGLGEVYIYVERAHSVRQFFRKKTVWRREERHSFNYRGYQHFRTKTEAQEYIDELMRLAEERVLRNTLVSREVEGYP